MKKYHTTIVQLDNKQEEKLRFLQRTETINHAGQLLDDVEFDSRGNQVHRYIYKYDRDDNTGKLTELYEYDGPDELVEHIRREYSDSGQLIREIKKYGNEGTEIRNYEKIDDRTEKITIYDEEETLGYELNIYDENGNKVSEAEYDQDREISKFEKKYQGKLLVEEKFYLNGSLEHTDVFTYNEQHWLVERRRTTGKGKLTERELNEYNENGRVTVNTIHHVLENYKTVEKKEYDDRGNVIYSATEKHGMLIFRSESVYDDNNMLIAQDIQEIDFEDGIMRNEKQIRELEENKVTENQ